MILTPPTLDCKVCEMAYRERGTTHIMFVPSEDGRYITFAKVLNEFADYTHSKAFLKFDADHGDVAHRQRDGTYWLYWSNTWTGPFRSREAVTAAVHMLL